MTKNFFYSDFAKLCKFKWDFLININDMDRWDTLSKNFQTFYPDLNKNIEIEKKIPKIIQQIWIGPKKIPRKYLNWGKTWIKNNPQWDYKLWSNKEINQMMMINKSLYNSIINIGFKSDLASYEILYKYGGIYIDTDFECIKEIPDNLRNFDFVSYLGFGYSPTILNGFLMAAPGCNVIEKIIYELNLPKNHKNPMAIINSSGPNKLTEIYFKYHNNNLIVPSNSCYPYPSFLLNSSVPKKVEISSVSFAIHHWEMSWMKGSLIERFLLKLNHFFKKYIKSNLKVS